MISVSGRALYPLREWRRVAAIGCAAAGCATDATPATPPEVQWVVVVPVNSSVDAGGTATFTAFGVSPDGRSLPGRVAWTATGGTIDPDGVFRADDALGPASVLATSAEWGLAGEGRVQIRSALPVASVTMVPASVTVPIAGVRRLQAVLLDSQGDTLGGRQVRWRSADSSIASVDQAGLVTGVDSGTTVVRAASNGHEGSVSVTVGTALGAPWPNEPAGLTRIADNGFDLLEGNGWAMLDNRQGLVSLVDDPHAPASPPSVLQYSYPAGFSDAGPGAAEHLLPSVREVFVGIWWKVSDPWQGHPSNVNKIQILFPNEGGDLYMVMYGEPGGPYEIRVIPQFRNMDPYWMLPNVGHVPVTLGQWHRIEWLVRYNTSSDPPNGVVRWWLDGVLIGDHTDVRFPDSPLVAYKISAIWGGIGGRKAESDYYWYDDVHLSGR